MASNINPNNIDTAYPIAGQDNDSQGFRDNFTNIKTNFEYAESEIDDLQSKVLLKSALTGSTLDNDLAGAVLENAKLVGTRYTKADTANTSGTISIDFSAAQYHKVGVVTGNATLSFSNIPSAGNYAEWTVELEQTASQYTITLPSAVSIGNASIQGNDVNNVITFDKAGTYAFKFSTTNGGTAIAIEDLLRNYTYGNVTITDSTISATGNVTGGNLISSGAITAVTTITATGNVTGGNLTTAGDVTTATVTATGNVSGGNLSVTASSDLQGAVELTNILKLNSFETVASNTALSTNLITSVITTSDDLALTLAGGSSGQTKILSYGNSSAGNAIVTVTDAAWGGSGTVTLVNAGSGATLQYINSAWYCIGANDVTFA
jgi:hypothetical protein